MKQDQVINLSTMLLKHKNPNRAFIFKALLGASRNKMTVTKMSLLNKLKTIPYETVL
jgi:hypothetical protein